MKKRKCQPQNYNCGKICIKGTYICHVEGLTGQSVSIAEKLASLIKETTPNKDIKIVRGRLNEIEIPLTRASIRSKVNDFVVKSMIFRDNSIAFSVNGLLDSKATEKATRQEKVKIARIVKEDMEKLIANEKEGTVLEGTAYTEDGKGEKRQKVYQKFGLGKPNEFGTMFGKIKDGKLVPEDPAKYQEADEEKTLEELIIEIL